MWYRIRGNALKYVIHHEQSHDDWGCLVIFSSSDGCKWADGLGGLYSGTPVSLRGGR